MINFLKNLFKNRKQQCNIPVVINSAIPQPKTLEERIEVLEKLCDMYYKELYTHHSDEVCVKGERISKIERLEQHCL